MEDETAFVTLHRLAQVLGLPSAWLRSEAESGRLPHLRIGARRLMFNVGKVEQALLARADSTSSPKREAQVA